MGIAEQTLHTGSSAAQHPVAEGNIEHERGKTCLQRKRRADNAQADRLAVGRKQECCRHDESDAQQAVDDMHRGADLS